MDEPDQKPDGSLLIYRADEATAPIRVLLEGETVWLTQRLIAELYGTSVPNMNQHIAAICEDEELHPEATVKKYSIVQTEGSRQVTRLVDDHNLDMIIAVGFRVRSTRGTQFRQWATACLGEYLGAPRVQFWLPRSSVGARANAPASRMAPCCRPCRRPKSLVRLGHTPTLERGSE